MRYAFLAVLFLLVSATACATEKGKIPEDTVSANPEVSVMLNQRTVICLKLKVLDKIMKEQHGETRVFSAETHENGAEGFVLFVGSDSWTAIEMVKGKGCIIQSGSLWAGSINLPGSSL
tara:strand:- start:202 stop:558 length:357 start_codon:yes stop_codon:yes gene_type:complete